ncbi:CD225/dispanin family protein [Nocardiopsis lambiniae]|uniref:CD225/dispanin family protein n=1 Tax=Nocardiopsis lambiniae TaxID=3075539 RepID=A0ABU2MD15_9ACTN|nr:CD225/dispanin family protein [Nocardiopsis sp. DSM 44743]MDT0330478.1 CD225/dispanin family protein [Nocardiopsis sp. DSM 44743]
MNMPAEQPKNYLGLNILGLFGCTVAGIIGIIFALQSKNKWEAGDHSGAQDAAKIAKITGIIGLIGFILVALYIVLVVIVGGAMVAGM